MLTLAAVGGNREADPVQSPAGAPALKLQL